MPEGTSNNNEISIFKVFWSIFLLGGFFSLAFSGIYISVVPLSSLFWPGEVYHALEMGFLITTMFWTIAFSGILFGRFIDKHSRKKILFLVALVRGFCLIMLSLAVEGKGMEMFWYFYIFIFIFAFFAGGNYPSIASLSDDVVPKSQRSRFFGMYTLMRNTFQLIGFILVGFLVQFGLWRLFFSATGTVIIISGVIMVFIIKEPKRGAQREELSDVLKGQATYDFKIDRKMMRETMFSKVNLIALIEGVFTSVYAGSLSILFLPYLQNPPHNVSPFSTGVFLAVFGLTGGIIGQVVLARLSDNWCKDNGMRRLYFIVSALAAGSFSFVFLFSLPLPNLTVEEGKDILYIFTFPVIWTIGLVYVGSKSISTLYDVNQPPILQEINLPEAQGKIVALNRLLESIGFGSGPLISGILITVIGQNYSLVALIIGLFAIPGIILWILSLRWYDEDRQNITRILEERSKILMKSVS